MAANHEQRSRQRTVECCVDITGSGRTGKDGGKAFGPRYLDYSRMSDADILNM